MELLDAYQKMLYIRIAEEELAKLYLEQKIMSFVHFYVGQEAVAVGVCSALEPKDKVLGNHRSHGHYLAKGGNFRRMVCELLGKAEGLARGKGGSMHMIDKSVNFSGSTPILGSVVPIASGVAFEQKYHNTGGVSVAFFGDGASEEGVVYETMNLAALWNLPLLLVIENNLYSVNSKIKDRRSSAYSVKDIVTGIGLRYEQADGLDYQDVHKKAHALMAGVRQGKAAVLECVTYRHMAHSAPIMDDAAGYREEDLLETRLSRDSIKKLKLTLSEKGVTEDAFAAMEQHIRTEILADIAYAQNAPYPDPSELTTDLYA